MYVCMYVCMCVYTYIHTYIYIVGKFGQDSWAMMGQKQNIPALYENSLKVWMFIPLNMGMICFYAPKREVILKHRG